LEIQEGGTTVGYFAFNNYPNLAKVTLAQSVIRIESNAFRNCTALKEIALPDNLQQIHSWAFMNCVSLESITIPATVWENSCECFSGCSGLKAIRFEGDFVSGDQIFNGVTADAYYPRCNSTWTDEARNIHATGADLTWIPYGKEHTLETIPGKDATCTETGLTEGKKCSVCDEITVAQEIIEALGHSEESIPGTDATCTESGLTEGKKCSVCGEITVAQETIEPLGHTEETIPGKDATCTETGLTEGKKCSVCGEITVAQEIIEALGHDWDDGLCRKTCNRCGFVDGDDSNHSFEIIVTQPTCTEMGREIAVCTICGTGYVNHEYPALGHSEECLPGVDATCTESGLTMGSKCNRCGEILIAQEIIEPKGHIEESIPGKDATCTESGLTEGKKCSICGEILILQEPIPATGVHTYENGSCKDCGEAEPTQPTEPEETEPVKPAAPKIKSSNVASSGKPRLTWNAVDGAVKYQIYRSTSKNGTYKLMYTQKGTTYTNTKAEAGQLYYYKVKAVDADGNQSNYSNRVSRTCDLARPTNVKATNVASSGKIKLTWNAVAGAKSYKVYRATSQAGKYTLMKTVTGTTYTNANAKAGTRYYYKVMAVHENTNANSAYSAIVSRVADLARPTITVKRNSSGTPRISWEKVDGAVKYEVWRATSKNGKYYRQITTKNTYLVNKSAVAGRTYYYKVRAIHSNTNANSAYSLVKYIKAK